MMKRVLLGLAAVAAITALLVLTYYQLMANQETVKEKVYQPEVDRVALVQVIEVERRQWSDTSRLLGVFEPERSVNVMSELPGRVIRVGVEEGDAVKTGTMLVQLDDERLHLQLIAAEAAYQDAQADLKRYRQLTAGDAAPGIQLEKAQLALRNAESQLKVLKKEIQNTTISAPFAGTITRRYFDLGSVFSSGAPVVDLVDISGLRLVIQAPEKEVLRFRSGQVLDVYADVYPGVRFRGTVDLIGIQGDQAHNYPVEIKVANSSRHPLKAGMYGAIYLGASGGETLVIPSAALLGSAKSPRVFVVENGRAVLRPVQIGRTSGSELEVLEGLKPGDVVITGGQINLQDGTPVSLADSDREG